jgi:hypothetical protein
VRSVSCWCSGLPFSFAGVEASKRVVDGTHVPRDRDGERPWWTCSAGRHRRKIPRGGAHHRGGDDALDAGALGRQGAAPSRRHGGGLRRRSPTTHQRSCPCFHAVDGEVLRRRRGPARLSRGRPKLDRVRMRRSPVVAASRRRLIPARRCGGGDGLIGDWGEDGFQYYLFRIFFFFI